MSRPSPTDADPLGLRALQRRRACLAEAEDALPPLRSKDPTSEMRAFARQLDDRRRDPRVRAAMDAEADERLQRLADFVRQWHRLDGP